MADFKKQDVKPTPTVKEAPLVAYRVGTNGHYRDGRLYAAGEVIRIPADEKQGREWTKVDEATAAVLEAKAAKGEVDEPKPGPVAPAGRASDRDV